MLQFCAEHGIALTSYSPLTSLTAFPGGPVRTLDGRPAGCLKIDGLNLGLNLDVYCSTSRSGKNHRWRAGDD